MQQRAVIDPKRQHGAARLEELVEARQRAADCARRVLGHVGGRQHRRGAEAEAADEAAHVQRRQLAARCGLEDDADDGEERDEEEAGLAAPFVRDGVREQRAGKGAGLHDGDDVGGEVGARAGFGLDAEFAN